MKAKLKHYKIELWSSMQQSDQVGWLFPLHKSCGFESRYLYWDEKSLGLLHPMYWFINEVLVHEF